MSLTRVLSLASAAVVVACAPPAAAQSISLGDSIRLTPIARLHADVRETRDAGGDVDVDFARRRVGVEGRITARVGFQVEREVDMNGGWRDVFADVHASRALQVRAGHFKVPFSREQLTSSGALDFIYRSRAAALLPPGRSVGVEVHGRTAGRTIGYAVGGFVDDGTAGNLPRTAGHEPTVAGRVTFKPGKTRQQRSFDDLEFGFAVAGTGLVEGRDSIRGRLTTSDVFFAPVFVSGRRLRVGGDVSWRPGPVILRAELLRAGDARDHQGVLGESLPSIRAQGWYVSSVWAVAGREAHARANDDLKIAGLAGLELAVRAEQLSIGTPGAAAGELWTPRAERLSTAGAQAWTFGVNWTANRFVKLQANAIREALTNRARGALPRAPTWSPVLRVQLAM